MHMEPFNRSSSKIRWLCMTNSFLGLLIVAGDGIFELGIRERSYIR